MSTETPTMVREDDLKTDHTGRVYLPDHIGEEGDTVQAVFITPDGDRKHFSATIISKHRITIPARWRTEYEIEAGDTVDVEVELA